MYLKLKVRLCTVLLQVVSISPVSKKKSVDLFDVCCRGHKKDLLPLVCCAVSCYVFKTSIPTSVNCLTYNSSTIVFEDPTSNSSSRYSEMGGCEKNRLQWLTT